MIDTHDDDDLRDAFQALRADDARTTPPFGRVTRPAPVRRRGAWLRWALVPVATMIAAILITRRDDSGLPDATVIRRAGAWQAPTDFLLRSGTDELLRPRAVLPDFNLPQAPAPLPTTVEHDS